MLLMNCCGMVGGAVASAPDPTRQRVQHWTPQFSYPTDFQIHFRVKFLPVHRLHMDGLDTSGQFGHRWPV